MLTDTRESTSHVIAISHQIVQELEPKIHQFVGFGGSLFRPDEESVVLCDSGTSLCPSEGLVEVNKLQKERPQNSNQSLVPKFRVSHTSNQTTTRKITNR